MARNLSLLDLRKEDFVITSYSIHYTKLYDPKFLNKLNKISIILSKYYFKYGLTRISNKMDYDVIVAGGGLAGTITAQAIAHYSNQNLKILSVDRNSEIFPGRKSLRITSYNVCYTKLLRDSNNVQLLEL